MRWIKYILGVCAAAGLVGCATHHDDHVHYDAQGRPHTDSGTYYDTSYDGYYGREPGLVEGLNRGVNTNYFGPVNAGAEAARGPGTPSGTRRSSGRF